MAKRPVIYKIRRVQHTENKITIVEYVREKLKPSEIRATIMKANNWTEDQYRKQYDIFKNKLRAYESYRKAHGANVEEQSPLEVLYRQAQAMKREGSSYKPSLEMKRIQSFSAVSITKGQRLAQDLESEYSKRRGETFAQTTSKSFKNFIRDNLRAQDIVYGRPLTENSNKDLIDKLTGGKPYTLVGKQIYVDGKPLWEAEPVQDPVKKEEALKALAERVHAEMSPTGEVFGGETHGSDDAAEDFDYSEWLED